MMEKKSQIKALPTIHVTLKFCLMFEENGGKMKLNEPESRNQKGRIPGSTQSMEDYIMTYSRLRKEYL